MKSKNKSSDGNGKNQVMDSKSAIEVSKMMAMPGISDDLKRAIAKELIGYCKSILSRETNGISIK